MSKGVFRFYFHIGSVGFKFAKINFRNANPFIAYLVSCIMNLLEYKRYRYYVKNKSFRQWGKKWKYEGVKPILCPVYFSCGIFSIVKHIPEKVTWEELIKEAKRKYKTENMSEVECVESYLGKSTVWLVKDLKADNFRRDKDSKLYCVDYGEFQCANLYRQSVCLIDYK